MFIKVKVFSGSRREEVIVKGNCEFEIKVREKAEKGRANKKVKELLSKFLNVPDGMVRAGSYTKNQNI